MFGGFGRVLAPIFLTVFVDESGDVDSGLKRAYLAASCLPVSACILLLSVSSNKVVNTKEEKADGKKGVTRAAGHNMKADEKEESQQYDHSFHRGLILCGILLLLFTGAQSTFQNFVSSYVISVGFSPKDSVLVAGVFGSSLLLGVWLPFLWQHDGHPYR